MNRRFWILSIKMMGAFILLILIFLCVSDAYVKQEKTVFEGWERPVFTEAENEEILSELETTEVFFENLTEEQSKEKCTDIEQHETEDTEIIERETQKEIGVPTVKLLKIQTENVKEKNDYTIKLSLPETTEAFGIMFMIYAENGGKMMDFSVFGDMPSGIKVTSLVEGGFVYILIDGKKKDGISEICFSAKIVCDSKNEKLRLKLIDAEIKT